MSAEEALSLGRHSECGWNSVPAGLHDDGRRPGAPESWTWTDFPACQATVMVGHWSPSWLGCITLEVLEEVIRGTDLYQTPPGCHCCPPNVLQLKKNPTHFGWCYVTRFFNCTCFFLSDTTIWICYMAAALLMEAWQRPVLRCRCCFSIPTEAAWDRTPSGWSSVLVIIRQDAKTLDSVNYLLIILFIVHISCFAVLTQAWIRDLP